VPRVRLFAAPAGALIGLVALVCPTFAQPQSPTETIVDVPLPGGVQSARTAINDSAAADRTHFLFDFIRRSYEQRTQARSALRDPAVQVLVTHLERSSGSSKSPLSEKTAEQMNLGSNLVAETVPVPLPAQVWSDVVFGGRATTQNLLAEILRSRNTALFYYGLFSLDDETRAWLANEHRLIKDLVARYPASFTIAAPGLRVANNQVRPPGGELAAPAWEGLVGRRTNEPAEFVRALLARSEGRLAYFFGAMAHLSDTQLRFGLNLEGADTDRRVDAARRLYAIFARIAESWKVEERTFWRPTFDPAMLLADLSVDQSGKPVLPGTTPFWNTVLAEAEPNTPVTDEAARRLVEGDPIDFASLCEQLFRANHLLYGRSHQLVLFASRVAKRVTPHTVHDAIVAIRAVGKYPALIATLERAGVDDVAIFARAARRAAQLSQIGDDRRAARALGQLQGAMFVVTRAALRGGLLPGTVNDAVSSLVAVELSERGDYEGRVVQWLADFMNSHQQRLSERLSPNGSTREDPFSSLDLHGLAPLELDVLRMMAGHRAIELPVVQWEGTRYRVDFPSAELTRLVRLLGEDSRPYLTCARTLVETAKKLSLPALTREALQQHTTVLEELVQSARWEEDVRTALQRAARNNDPRHASRVAANLRLLADDLLARGLTQFAYAAALGRPDRALISAGEAASRHDFGLQEPRNTRLSAWSLPVASADRMRDWGVTGSVLGLDVTLAHLALVSVSSKPPLRSPTIPDADRRAFIDAVALIERAALTDADMSTIVTAIRKGRARVSSLRTDRDAVALADEIHLSQARRTLLSWMVTHEPERVPTFLAPIELFWLGMEGAPINGSLHAWGAPAGTRIGCLCLYLDASRPWELLAGRWGGALLASGFPDLNLRIAELLSELTMPAALLAPVLAAATLDFVNTANSRDPDDRRGLVEFVRGLRLEQVEQYLALLTTDGPLVPINESAPGEWVEAYAGVPR
jgi:hypothetical protein